MENLQGKLVAFCGIHGCGEHVDQAIKVLQRICQGKGRKVSVVNGLNVSGLNWDIEEIWRLTLLTKESLEQQCEGRQWLFEEIVNPAIERGEVVFAKFLTIDLLVSMQMSQQDAKTVEWLMEKEKEARSMIIPDLTVFVDISPAEAAEWAKAKGFDYYKYSENYYEEMRIAYLKILEQMPGGKYKFIPAPAHDRSNFFRAISHLKIP